MFVLQIGDESENNMDPDQSAIVIHVSVHSTHLKPKKKKKKSKAPKSPEQRQEEKEETSIITEPVKEV